jgi:16S rRNA (cytidine1402-2'-O)-methyltransferase
LKYSGYQFLYYLYSSSFDVLKGTLFLIPVTLGGDNIADTIPSGVSAIISLLRVFVVEEIRTARRYLRKTDPVFPIDDSVFYVLNEHTRNEDMEEMLDSALDGKDIGLMSEAGLPGIADPGSALISLAHRKGIRVKPLSGPSSILLALISSGMNGQSFTFNGYLPVKPDERHRKIRELEERSRSGESQIFMETPYRNLKLFNDLISSCNGSTRLCIAAGLTTDKEYILSRTIKEWKGTNPPIDRIPTVFILQS